MKITIYSEPSSGALGGAEVSVATLAHALSRAHDVRVLHHREDVTRASLGAFASLDLSRVDTVYVKPASQDAWSCSTTSNPLVRFHEAKAWQAELSKGADLFINFTHGVPPFCHAAAGVLVVLFPMFNRTSTWPWTDAGSTSAWKRAGRRAYYEWEWKQRLDSYGTQLSISAFTRQWTQRWWGARTRVVYPPVNTHLPIGPKRNVILSVGRFATTGHSKQQLAMVERFCGLSATLPDWTYVCAGALGESAPDQEYFERVRQAADSACVLRANATREDLKRMYGSAKVFWHAAGFGDREDLNPEMSEHFGIATVEAMAAGCVPVVINRGGQREIVTHGVDGFLWNTLDELEKITRELATNEHLRRRISTQARLRAQDFGADVFIREVNSVISPAPSSDTRTAREYVARV